MRVLCDNCSASSSPVRFNSAGIPVSTATSSPPRIPVSRAGFVVDGRGHRTDLNSVKPRIKHVTGAPALQLQGVPRNVPIPFSTIPVPMTARVIAPDVVEPVPQKTKKQHRYALLAIPCSIMSYMRLHCGCWFVGLSACRYDLLVGCRHVDMT